MVTLSLSVQNVKINKYLLPFQESLHHVVATDPSIAVVGN